MDFELNLNMVRMEIAFQQYKTEYERSRFLDQAEEVYSAWNKTYQDYWATFSPVYRDMSEFYYGEDLPVAFIWRFIQVIYAAWQLRTTEVD